MAEGRQGWGMGHAECARECWLDGSKGTKGVKKIRLPFSVYIYIFFGGKRKIIKCALRGRGRGGL